MGTSSIRVLVVDDVEPFRRFVVSTLQASPKLQVIGEVSDGLEAVRKAQDLQPDLILLDIGLPGLNGIEAARRIRRFSPKSKILFVSQESSADVVQHAFSLGACGYVVKIDAGGELLAAVDALLRGEQFVGSRFAGHDFTGASYIKPSDPGNPEKFRRETVFAPLLQEQGITRRHEVGFYSDDQRLLDDVTQFIGTAMKAGNAAIVVATESHRNGVLAGGSLYAVHLPRAIPPPGQTGGPPLPQNYRNFGGAPFDVRPIFQRCIRDPRQLEPTMDWIKSSMAPEGRRK